jgi:hypothetical protein
MPRLGDKIFITLLDERSNHFNHTAALLVRQLRLIGEDAVVLTSMEDHKTLRSRFERVIAIWDKTLVRQIWLTHRTLPLIGTPEWIPELSGEPLSVVVSRHITDENILRAVAYGVSEWFRNLLPFSGRVIESFGRTSREPCRRPSHGSFPFRK